MQTILGSFKALRAFADLDATASESEGAAGTPDLGDTPGEQGGRLPGASTSATGFTPRSEDPMDFLTFGARRAVLERQGGGARYGQPRHPARPIAHCNPLAEDEVVRLRLAVRDWFRLSE